MSSDYFDFGIPICCYNNLFSSFHLLSPSSHELLHSPVHLSISNSAATRVNIHILSLRTYQQSLRPGSARNDITGELEVAMTTLSMLTAAGPQMGAQMRRTGDGSGILWLRCEMGQGTVNECTKAGSKEFKACGRLSLEFEDRGPVASRSVVSDRSFCFLLKCFAVRYCCSGP